MSELMETLKDFGAMPYRILAGGTDLLLELKRRPQPGLAVVNLGQLRDERFGQVGLDDGAVWIGAGVTAANLCHNEWIAKRWPVLCEAAMNLASTQIRMVATVGGNLVTGSPSGDLICALVAMGAVCRLTSTWQVHETPINEFYLGPRITSLSQGEILYGVVLPMGTGYATMYSRFVKVGTRRAMECSVVSVAMHVEFDEHNRISRCGLALGAVAPTVIDAREAADMLVGKQIGEINAELMNGVVAAAVGRARPISDLRASAWYRTQVLGNVVRGLMEEMVDKYSRR
jgi:CO/xanthine dehydrogenase FAD-binding subunit